jgi:hypothetical protein
MMARKTLPVCGILSSLLYVAMNVIAALLQTCSYRPPSRHSQNVISTLAGYTAQFFSNSWASCSYLAIVPSPS